jgi:hypothetical protein
VTVLFEDPGNFAIARDVEGFTPLEQDQADRIEQQGRDAPNLAVVALAIGGAYLLWRRYMQRRMRAQITPDMTASRLRQNMEAAWRLIQPGFVKCLAPTVARAYVLGALDTEAGVAPKELLDEASAEYARTMGDYLNDTSAQALEEGFNAYVNKKVPRKIAAEKAVDAIGLTPRETRSVVAAEKLTDEVVTSVVERVPDSKIKRHIQTMLLKRAKRIGDSEAYVASRQGKQLVWMYWMHAGRLPVNTKKQWITASDELVCESCGPLHKKKVPLNKPFRTELGEVWTPSAHPGCRCDVQIDQEPLPEEEVTKALAGVALAEFNEEHPRDKSGRFSDKPEVNEIAAELDRLFPAESPKIASPKIGRGIGGTISGGKIKAQEKRPESKPKIGGPSEKERPKISAGMKAKIAAGNKILIPPPDKKQIEQKTREHFKPVLAEALAGAPKASGKPVPLDQPLFFFGSLTEGHGEKAYSGDQGLGAGLSDYWQGQEEDFLDQFHEVKEIQRDGWTGYVAARDGRAIFWGLVDNTDVRVRVEGLNESGAPEARTMTAQELAEDFNYNVADHMPVIYMYDEVHEEDLEFMGFGNVLGTRDWRPRESAYAAGKLTTPSAKGFPYQLVTMKPKSD